MTENPDVSNQLYAEEDDLIRGQYVILTLVAGYPHSADRFFNNGKQRGRKILDQVTGVVLHGNLMIFVVVRKA